MTNNEKNGQKTIPEKFSMRWWIVLAMLVVVLLNVAWGIELFISWHAGDKALITPVAVATAMGLVNVVLAPLGVVLLLATLWLSQRQLDVQHEQLRGSLEEMRAQRCQMEAQNAFLAKQAVQTQIGQMVQSWQTVLEQVVFGGCSGRAAFDGLARMIGEDVAILIHDKSGSSALDKRRIVIEQAYEKLKGLDGVHIGHYFRLLYHTIRLIDENPLLIEVEKTDQVRYIRAHLSEGEFVLLFYNCIHEDGEKLYPLVEQYDLLQNMDERSLVYSIDLDFYPRTKQRWEKIGKMPLGKYQISGTGTASIRSAATQSSPPDPLL